MSDLKWQRIIQLEEENAKLRKRQEEVFLMCAYVLEENTDADPRAMLAAIGKLTGQESNDGN